ncbi:MAG: SAM-dependent methyltransferase [Candidatus Bathyarchaeota archaeon]|nr:MAG: SAM-dependent methyltransferase [Candidatus Bathyarchaeota archaeon]
MSLVIFMASLAPFVPTPREIVKKMLEIAHVSSDDVVFDLGCGDGRILITAIQDFGAKKAIGFEMREDLYKQALQEIRKQSLENRITIINGDVFTSNLSEATVITLYLTTSGNEKLKPKLSNETNPGTRIVSHDFEISGWYASKREKFFGHAIYLYNVPEAHNVKVEKRSFLRKFLPL